MYSQFFDQPSDPLVCKDAVFNETIALQDEKDALAENCISLLAVL
jgi:hypothetical protein